MEVKKSSWVGSCQKAAKSSQNGGAQGEMQLDPGPGVRESFLNIRSEMRILRLLERTGIIASCIANSQVLRVRHSYEQ